jgi:hypothetical protein
MINDKDTIQLQPVGPTGLKLSGTEWSAARGQSPYTMSLRLPELYHVA